MGPVTPGRTVSLQKLCFCIHEIEVVTVSGMSCLDACDNAIGIEGGSRCLVNCKEFYSCKTLLPLQVFGH